MDEFKLYLNQLKAMLIRNLTLKFREKRKLLWEVLLPVYSFVVLALMKIIIPNPNYPALNQPPYVGSVFDNDSLYLNYTVAVVPNTTQVGHFLNDMSNKWDDFRNNIGNELQFVLFDSKDELNEQYWYEPTSLSMAIIFNTSDPISDYNLDYEIRSNPSFTVTPSGSNLYADRSACRASSHILTKAFEKTKINEEDDCPAYLYYASGFVTLQTLIDYTKISIMSGMRINLTQINFQLLPKEAYTAADWMLIFRLVIPAYLVMSLSQFVTYLLMLIVKEKENKIKDTLSIAGLNDPVFWLSWFLVYAMFVIIMGIVATSIMFYLGVLHHSNFFLIFLLILLYGFSIIIFSFMITPFLNHYRTAGIIGNFIVNSISLLYLIRLIVKKIDVKFLYLVSLISPTAFTLAMDKALTMDMSGDGLNFNNLWSGPGLTFGCSFIILCVDNILYIVLAYYFSLVIPGDYGVRRHPLFFLTPVVKIYNFILKRKPKTKSKSYIISENTNNEDIEPVSDNLKDKIGIEIIDLYKHFTPWFRKEKISVIKGINLNIYEGQITAILGHNGAGKTTLFNILTGMTKPSSGTALIFGHDIRIPDKLNIVRKMFGVCPQHNVLFDNLTSREHLTLYSAIRGIPKYKQEEEVTKLLHDTCLNDQAETFSKHLSGGQKRKLTIACAVIGSPKILIFDEPTAGIDPCSRRNVWSLLQKHKPGKVILLTTHFMDEADLLADRKAVISNGQIRCVGTSLFLKNKFGIGYHLTLVLKENKLSNEILRVIRRHVPQAELARHNGKELSLILPYSSVSKFAALFNELETDIYQGGNHLQISSYGISMTTLEEVFLYLEKSEELGQESNIGNKVLKRRIEGIESRSLRRRRLSSLSVNVEQTGVSQSEFNEDQQINVSGIGLGAIKVNPDKCKIFRIMIKLRFWNFLREPSRCITIIFIPLIFFIIGIHFVYKNNLDLKLKSLILDESIYENSTFIIQDSANDSDFKNYLISEHMLDINVKDITKVKSNLGIIKINECCEHINITVMYNDTTIHSLPVLINIIDNALYNMLVNNSRDNEEKKITTKSFPFLSKNRPGLFDFSLVTIAFGLGVQFVAISIILTTEYIYDRELKAKNLLRVNGLSFWIYYGSFFIVLTLAMFLIIGLHLIMIVLFDLAPFKQPVSMGILTFLLILYTPCAILFSTTLSYFFHSAETTQSVLLNSITFIGLIPYALVLLLDVLQIKTIYMFILHTIFSMFDSFYLPFAIIYFVGRIYLGCLSNEACSYVTIKDYFSAEILIIATSCCLQISIFLLLLQLQEYWRTEGTLQCEKRNINFVNTNIDDEIDNDDVKLEKFKVTNYLNSRTDYADHPRIIVKDLKKCYGELNYRNICRKTKNTHEKREVSISKNSKLALSGLTFAVGPGEIFGLLGHNGAGKSTTLKILTAEELPDNGQIQLMGHNILEENFKKVLGFIGYCPQDDILWKNITVEEHIKLYATIRGIPSDKIQEITDTYLSALRIREHANKFSNQCSGGTKRKLSFAIAMIGNPNIVFMDEPTVGMDPHSKRFLWDTILCSFQESRSAILTTQAMEEADALCSRVGIMVNGKLKCIGSTQHLKNTYGAGYTLEIKIISDNKSMIEKERRVKRFVNGIFHSSTLEETFSDHLVFSIPQCSVKSLAHCFTEIENAKKMLGIEEYSFSQITLEQVFIKMSHAEDAEYLA